PAVPEQGARPAPRAPRGAGARGRGRGRRRGPAGRRARAPLRRHHGMSRPSAALRRPEYVGDPLRDAWRRLTRLRDRVAPRVRRWAASPRFWLGAGGAVILAVTLAYISWIATFFVMSDELTYIKEAIHVWDRGGPLPSSDIFYASVSQ